MATIYHNGWSFEIELNGKVYRTKELNGEVYLIDESGRRYMAFELNDKIYMTCGDGHLENLEDWSKEVADYLAKEENIEMTDVHWEVVNFLREYYEEYSIAPMIKTLVKVITKKLGHEKGNLKYLYELFPKGAMQANRIAGLPRPHGTP